MDDDSDGEKVTIPALSEVPFKAIAAGFFCGFPIVFVPLKSEDSKWKMDGYLDRKLGLFLSAVVKVVAVIVAGGGYVLGVLYLLGLLPLCQFHVPFKLSFAFFAVIGTALRGKVVRGRRGER